MSALYNLVDPLSGAQVIRTFSADTSGHAQSFAQSMAAQLGMSLMLCPLAVATPSSGTSTLFTTYTAGSQVSPGSLNVVI